MRIKIINPNTTLEMTRAIEAAARRYASPGTELSCVSPRMGPESIESYYDEYLSIPGVLEEILIGERREGVDAFVIACFGDPGLKGAREASRRPVIGIAEAAIATARFIAPSFSVVDVLDRSRNLTEETIRMHGAWELCRSVRTTNLGVLDFARDPGRGLRALAEQSRRAVEEDRAECILLGCAGFVDFVEDLQKSLGVPVLDGVAPAVKYAEALVQMGITTSKHLTYRAPEPKKITGFPPILQPDPGVAHEG